MAIQVSGKKLKYLFGKKIKVKQKTTLAKHLELGTDDKAQTTNLNNFPISYLILELLLMTLHPTLNATPGSLIFSFEIP